MKTCESCEQASSILTFVSKNVEPVTQLQIEIATGLRQSVVAAQLKRLMGYGEIIRRGARKNATFSEAIVKSDPASVAIGDDNEGVE